MRSTRQRPPTLPLLAEPAASVLNSTTSHAVVDGQDEDRSEDGGDEGGTLIGALESDKPAQEGGDDRSGHAQRCRHEEAPMV
jgi:hypothetical protein